MVHRNRGHCIVFCGLDGAGKTTQIALLMDALRRQGKRPMYLWTRGGYTPLMERLKGLLRRMAGRRLPPPGQSLQRTATFQLGTIRRLWLALAIAELVWIYGVRIRCWCWSGLTVVCDRYLWDTLIDFRLGFPQEHVERWALWHVLRWAAQKPDSAFSLLIPVNESVRRSDTKGEPFRDPPEKLQRRLLEYEELTPLVGWTCLDGCRSAEDIASDIRAAVHTGSAILVPNESIDV